MRSLSNHSIPETNANNVSSHATISMLYFFPNGKACRHINSQFEKPLKKDTIPVIVISEMSKTTAISLQI